MERVIGRPRTDARNARQLSPAVWARARRRRAGVQPQRHVLSRRLRLSAEINAHRLRPRRVIAARRGSPPIRDGQSRAQRLPRIHGSARGVAVLTRSAVQNGSIGPTECGFGARNGSCWPAGWRDVPTNGSGSCWVLAGAGSGPNIGAAGVGGVRLGGLRAADLLGNRRCSSVVERTLGKGEVASSSLASGFGFGF